MLQCNAWYCVLYPLSCDLPTPPPTMQTEAELAQMDLHEVEHLAAEAAELQQRAALVLRLAQQRMQQRGSSSSSARAEGGRTEVPSSAGAAAVGGARKVPGSSGGGSEELGVVGHVGRSSSAEGAIGSRSAEEGAVGRASTAAQRPSGPVSQEEAAPSSGSGSTAAGSSVQLHSRAVASSSAAPPPAPPPAAAPAAPSPPPATQPPSSRASTDTSVVQPEVVKSAQELRAAAEAGAPGREPAALLPQLLILALQLALLAAFAAEAALLWGAGVAQRATGGRLQLPRHLLLAPVNVLRGMAVVAVAGADLLLRMLAALCMAGQTLRADAG